jgi:putative ABC transport system permease protein
VLGGLSVTLWGLAAGAVLAFASAQLIRMLLYGVSPLDPIVYAAVAVILAGVSIAAAYLPGRRAMRVDPAVALRSE